MKEDKAQPKTLVINKFNGRTTRFQNGDINSGLSPVCSSTIVPWGYDAQQISGTLVFDQVATSIKGSVITDLVMAGKERVESSIIYVYAIGHTGRLYKIQVNKPSTNSPDYDNPVLLATLANGQTFKYGSSLDFFTISGTEYIIIGHDTGITKIATDGTGESNITASFTANVPRQQVQFAGAVYITDGVNLAKYDSTGTVTTHTALSPGFPSNMQARDIRLTADGRYIVTVCTRASLMDMTSVGLDTNLISATNSLLVYWNGTDTAASSSTSFPYFPVSSYYTFGAKEYIFGEQVGGAMLGQVSGGDATTINVLEFETAPYPNSISSSGDYMGWFSTRFVNGAMKMILNLYGTIDNETPVGFYKQLLVGSTLTGGDIIRVPFGQVVSSWQPSGATSGYTSTYKLYGTGKSYFSTIEYDGVNTSYNFYAFHNVVDFITNANTGNYQTQIQLFSKKIKPTEVRVYLNPPTYPTLTSFTIDLMGISNATLTGGSFTFTNSNQLTTTSDMVKYQPTVGATTALGLRITNAGTVTPVIQKVEIDYTPYGT